MSEVIPVETSVEHKRIKGRRYEVTVNKRHRPAQIHREVVPRIYVGEVTTENAGEFNLMYIDADLHQRVMRLFGNDTRAGTDLTFNQALLKMTELIEGDSHLRFVCEQHGQPHVETVAT